MITIVREVEIRMATLFYFISSILALSLPSDAPSFFLHWIATTLLLIHIIKNYSCATPISIFWRIYALLVYGITTSSILSTHTIQRSSSNMLVDYTSASIVIGIIGIIVSILTGFILYLLPLPYLPKPVGKYSRIGTHTFHIQKSRDMVIQCWFPLKKDNNISWWKQIWIHSPKKSIMWTTGHPEFEVQESIKLFEALSELNNTPMFVFNHLMLARSNSEWCDEIDLSLHATDKYPVAIYSHGLYGWRQLHHTACELLASNGFIVFSIDHTPDATVSRPHKDPRNSARFDFDGPEDDGSYGPLYRNFYKRGLERRSNDIVELLDYLNMTPVYAERLHADKVYLWGHSYGGGTVGTVAALDTRVGGVGMWDSWMFPMPDEARSIGTKAPVLCVSSELWSACRFQSPFREDFLKHSKSKFPGCNLIFRGTDHQNFCDVIHLTSRYLLTRPSSIGPNVNPNIVADALDRLLVTFFLCLHYSSTFLDSCSTINTNIDINPDPSQNDNSNNNNNSSSSSNPSPTSEIAKELLDNLFIAKEGIVDKIEVGQTLLNEKIKEYLIHSLMDAKTTPHCYEPTFFEKLVNSISSSSPLVSPSSTRQIDKVEYTSLPSMVE